MFLSSRWGVTSAEIESLPVSEFNKQKLFWEHSVWGVTDDLLAMQHAFFKATKLKDVGTNDIPSIKKTAALTSSAKTFVVESTRSIRKAFMGIASLMKKRNAKHK